MSKHPPQGLLESAGQISCYRPAINVHVASNFGDFSVSKWLKLWLVLWLVVVLLKSSVDLHFDYSLLAVFSLKNWYLLSRLLFALSLVFRIRFPSICRKRWKMLRGQTCWRVIWAFFCHTGEILAGCYGWTSLKYSYISQQDSNPDAPVERHSPEWLNHDYKFCFCRKLLQIH